MRSTKPHERKLAKTVADCAVLLGLGLCMTWSPAQTVPVRSNGSQGVPVRVRAEDAIDDVKAGDFTFTDVEVIAASPKYRTATISVLEGRFRDSQVASRKGRIASALIRLGDRDDIYWNYLVSQAIPAAEDDAPFFLERDGSGNYTNKISLQFLRWAADRNLTTGQAIETESEINPGAIDDLGSARDERAVPILRQALSSPNFLVESAAARSLANIGDRDSIPLIASACSKAPPKIAAMIAVSLVYFDDSAAQQAVNLYVPKDQAADARKARASGMNIYGTGLLDK